MIRNFVFDDICMSLLACMYKGNPLHRAIYDRYGESGLLQGVLLPNGYFPPYQYHGDNMKIYQDVFGNFSPYANLMDGLTNPPPLYTNKVFGIGVKTKDPPVERMVAVDLEEVRSGCVKIMNLLRLEFVDDEQIVTEKRKKTLKLEIKPGTTAGTRFTFKEEGDRNATKVPADVIFIVEDKPHPRFKRQNLHDLVYKHTIDLCQALTGFKFVVETLDKRKLKISITNVVYPGFRKILPGEGLPKCKVTDQVEDLKPIKSEPLQYGDLIIEFESKERPASFIYHYFNNRTKLDNYFLQKLFFSFFIFFFLSIVVFPTYLNNEMKILCKKFFDGMHEIAFKERQCKNQNVTKLS